MERKTFSLGREKKGVDVFLDPIEKAHIGLSFSKHKEDLKGLQSLNEHSSLSCTSF